MKTWRERIADARARGYFTDKDVIDAYSWHTCAVGEYHQQHPDIVVYHNPLGQECPEDAVLLIAGGRFFNFGVAEGRHRELPMTRAAIDRAESFLNRIEDRVLELKRTKEEPSALTS